MVAPHTPHKNRRPLKPITHAAPRRTVGAALKCAAISAPAKAAYVVIGAVGLAALATAILRPKQLERQVLGPLRNTVGPKAEKLWDQAKPAREQIAGLFRQAGAERKRLARDFQSWIGHFRTD